MKILLALLFFAFSETVSFAQKTYTSRKGSKFFSGYIDIEITFEKPPIISFHLSL